MEIDGRITFLIGRDGTEIQITDRDARMTFVRIKLTPYQLSSALSRISETETEKCEIFGLDKIGLKHENDSILIPTEFKDRFGIDESKLDPIVDEYVNKNHKGWEADHYYNSQGTYVKKDEKLHIRQTIRRWVKK
jgi:hypothetical protein